MEIARTRLIYSMYNNTNFSVLWLSLWHKTVICNYMGSSDTNIQYLVRSSKIAINSSKIVIRSSKIVIRSSKIGHMDKFR